MHEIVVATVLALVGGLYTRGVMVVSRRSRRARYSRSVACFAAGWLSLVVALISPLDALGEKLFSAHMVQHELIMAVAAPLIVLSRPMPMMLWAFSGESRRAIGGVIHSRPARAVWYATSAPFTAWVLHGAVIWLWHVPVLFQATLSSELVHALQHLSFFASAVLFWWSIIQVRRRSRRGTAIISLFTTAVHTSVLGALLTFSLTPWYPAYASLGGEWGLSPLADQQLAGLVMWIPASVVYLVACLAAAHLYLQDSEWAVADAEQASLAVAR
jgi:putative membrane protein